MGNGRRTPARRLLPEDAPPELRAFVACTQDSLRLDLEETDWLPAPGGVDAVEPDVSVEPGPGPGQLTVTASWGGFIEVSVPVSVVDGKLTVDTSAVPPFLSSDVRRWVDDLNRHLEGNGKEFDGIELDGTSVRVAKRAVTVVDTAAAVAVPAGEAQPGDESIVDELMPGGSYDPERQPTEPEDRLWTGRVRQYGRRTLRTWPPGRTITAGAAVIGLAAIALFVIPLSDDQPNEPVAAAPVATPGNAEEAEPSDPATPRDAEEAEPSDAVAPRDEESEPEPSETPVGSAAPPTATQTCHGTDHFPEEPAVDARTGEVTDSPSKQQFVLDTADAPPGSVVVLAVDGPGGPREGAGEVADGSAVVDVPLFSFGEHTITGARIETPDGSTTDLAPLGFGDGGGFTVDDTEQAC